MKIALVTHDVVRGEGQGRVNYEIVRHALDRQVEVTLVAARVDPELIERGAAHVPVHCLARRPALLREWDFARQADRLVPGLRAGGAIVIGNGFSLRAPHDVNVSHMVHAEWQRVARRLAAHRWTPEAIYRRYYTAANVRRERQSYSSAALIVAVSDFVRQSLVSIGMNPQRIRVVPNGVDTDEFRPGAESRSELGLPDGVPLGIFVGDLRTPLKNLDSVLKALRSHPQVHLAVVGNAERSIYPGMAREMGLSDRVHFLGRRRDLARVMRACDFCVFPSRCDAFGLVVLEALASGLPVIVSPAAGASALVGPDCGVVLRDPEDVPGLSDGIGRLAVPAARATMAPACRRVAEAHTWSRMAERFLHVCDEASADQGRVR